MMARCSATDCSTTKPVAVVAPCRHVTNLAGAESLTHATTCHDEHRRRQVQASSALPGHDNVSDDRQRCSGSTDGAARWNEVDRNTSTCTVRPSLRPAQSDDDDDVRTCPFYHGNITSDQAKRHLADQPQGTYLLRDSQSADFPLSLSVRTSGQPAVTSLRIAHDGSGFRLDCDEAHRASMPTFCSVLRLVRHFVAECDGGEGGQCVLVGSSARHEQPLKLSQPLYRPTFDN